VTMTLRRLARTLASWAAGAALLAGGCRTAPGDPFRAGELEASRGQLAAALLSFDSVPSSDPHYAEARLAAAGVERRLRHHLELLLLGLQLRGEWRDPEALAAFEQARTAWPDAPDVAPLIAATQARRQVTAAFAGPLTTAEPARPGAADGNPAVPGAAPAAEVAVPDDPVRSDDAPSAEVTQIEARMHAGDVDTVLGDLLALQRRYPGDRRLAIRASRLLEQRGLVHYGQGNVAAALADWQRAFELDPALRSARLLFDLASAELAAPGR
jgi:tetratricopeptide (TPR) repeat protein